MSRARALVILKLIGLDGVLLRARFHVLQIFLYVYVHVALHELQKSGDPTTSTYASPADRADRSEGTGFKGPPSVGVCMQQ